ncbi:MAG: Sua5/YciO/YrdC/YwlC family protein [Candidatus Gracilibacteria bacterium]|nr:Sua5/YciO/YrdC/YwlC family protein [Candidatus Gracilibacteria bacterium]
MVFAVSTDTCYGFACNFYDESGYDEIFEIKNRDKSKLMSIAVKDFSELERISKLNSGQIDFLKTYHFPFTIVTEIKDDFIIPPFLDKSLYKDFGIRVAGLFLTDEMNEILDFPIFLTSANNSGEKEIYDYSEFENIFSGHDITIIKGRTGQNLTSNIFKFIGDSIELDYIRKNY